MKMTRKNPLEARIKKLEQIREKGIDPYPHYYSPENRVPDLLVNREEDIDINIAGRIMGSRKMGRSTFLDLVDQQSRIQLYLNSSNLGDQYGLLDLLDVGDFVGVTGKTFNTKTGEYSVNVSDLQLLAKSLRPLPDKWHGLKNPELRYALRTLDFIANPDVMDVFVKRSKIVSSMRAYLDGHGYLEVDTPLVQPIYGGASAKPFITHVNALDRDYFLSISPELYLKKLIAGGFDAVYTISKNFRNEGIDRSHNPEFTMMECYKAYEDYNGMMGLTEEMIAEIALTVNNTTTVNYQNHSIDFEVPWQRLSMTDGVEKYTGIRVDSLTEGELKDTLKSGNYLENEDFENMSKGEIIEVLFDEYASSDLIQPVFVTDHPIESTPLCKPHRDKEGLIERFEPYVAGMEIGNAYTELNDPVLQRKLFEDEIRRLGPDNPYLQLDENFLVSMEYGMPPTGGLGIGIDRVTMLLTGQTSIKDVILFPMTKAEVK